MHKHEPHTETVRNVPAFQHHTTEMQKRCQLKRNAKNRSVEPAAARYCEECCGFNHRKNLRLDETTFLFLSNVEIYLFTQ